MKKLSFLSLFLFFIPLVYANLCLEPSRFSVEIVGGENITKTISLVWRGEAPAVAYLSYEIEQINGTYEGKEMWINFSSNPIILEPNKPKEVVVTISTKPNIEGGEYLVKIYANVSVGQVVKTIVKRRIVYKYINVTRNVTVPEYINITVEKWYENTTKIEQLEQKIKELEQNLTQCRKSTEILEEALVYAKKESEWYFKFFSFCIILLFSVCIIYFYFLNKRNK